MPRSNVLLAMFDVRPTKSGGLDFEKILRVKRQINLRKEKRLTIKLYEEVPETRSASFETSQLLPVASPLLVTPPRKSERPVDPKISILREFEDVFLRPVNTVAELTRVGGRVHPFVKQKPRPHFIAKKTVTAEARKTSDEKKEPLKNKGKLVTLTHRPVLPTGIPLPLLPRPFGPSPFVARPAPVSTAGVSLSTPVSREVDFWLTRLDSIRREGIRKTRVRPKFRLKLPVYFGRKFLTLFVIILSVGALIWWLVQSGIWVRNNIVQNGSNAVANLEEAKQKLEELKFQEAANSFALAYDDLSRASGTLNELGASFLSIFGSAGWRMPGLGKIKAANDLVEAGRSVSKAGENLTSALGTLYNSNPLSFLSHPAGSAPKSLSELLGNFRAVLINADRSIKKANGLLAHIDSSVIPADKQAILLDFKERIPQFQEYIGRAIDYSDFLLKFVGAGGRKTYLVLLQNNSELRPTGGFPGTYALISFKDGNLAKVFVDDIYQIDANMRENIIPPLQMQHITPNWGMRDANWFADFPTSARKIQEFYRKNGGGEVDGVLTITPDVIAKIFKVIGPIDMPEYELKLEAGNFLTEIQNEVEYEADRSEPKKILADLAPRFLEKLGEQEKNNWVEIFKIILKAAEEKHILAHFNDPSLQKVAVDNGLGGEVKQTAGDFLEIIFANIKGSKTDFLTNSSFNLETSLAGDGIEHSLTISRVHNGGDSQYGFYNRDNSAYVKIFVPKGSVLEEIRGQTIANFRPLLDYQNPDFKRDPDLKLIEENVEHPVAGVDVFEESGKTVFGFWLIVKPKETKSVALKYRTPVAEMTTGNYNLYWQKQSGTGGGQINFSFKLPEGASITGQSPELQLLGNNLVLNSDLSVDRQIKIQFR